MEREGSDGESIMHQELSTDFHDPLIRFLHVIIRACIKILAVLLVLVIMLGVVDVCYHLYDYLKTPPLLHLSVSEMFEAFGAFMVVLIGIEIFINIRLYLGSNTLPNQIGDCHRADGYRPKGNCSRFVPNSRRLCVCDWRRHAGAGCDLLVGGWWR